MMKRLPTLLGRRKGFSLIEVAAAMAIFVFVLVTLLALMSRGVSACREAIDLGTATQMANAEINKAMQASFSSLKVNTSTESFYDDVGKYLGIERTNAAVYRVHAKVEESAEDPVLPGYDPQRLKRLVITVCHAAQSDDDNADARTFSYLLFNND